MVTSNWQEWQVPEHFLSMIVAGMLTIVQQAPLPKQARLSPPQPASGCGGFTPCERTARHGL